MMKYVYQETANYKCLVDALYKGMAQGDINKYIKCESVIYKNVPIESSNIYVCQNTNETLLQMGLNDHFVYDKDHFFAHLYDPLERKHGHNGTIDDLQKLPQLLQKPLAILTADSYRHDVKYGEYKPIIMLFCEQNESSPIYRMAVVQPQDYYFGLTEHYSAAKIITYHQEAESVVNMMLNSTRNKRYDLLFFDTEQYRNIRSSSKLRFLEQNKFQHKGIYEYIKPIDNLERKIEQHTRAIRAAADIAVCRYGNGEFIQQDIYHNPFERAIDTLNSKKSTLEELLEAKTIIERVCELARDRNAIKKTRAKTDVLFAKGYVRVMTTQEQDRIYQSACLAVEKSARYICTEDDMDMMYDEIENQERLIPTLNNLGIHFDGTVADNPDIIQASKISGVLGEMLSSRLQEMIDKKYEEIDGYDEPGDDGDFSRER